MVIWNCVWLFAMLYRNRVQKKEQNLSDSFIFFSQKVFEIVPWSESACTCFRDVSVRSGIVVFFTSFKIYPSRTCHILSLCIFFECINGWPNAFTWNNVSFLLKMHANTQKWNKKKQERLFCAVSKYTSHSGSDMHPVQFE